MTAGSSQLPALIVAEDTSIVFRAGASQVVALVIGADLLPPLASQVSTLVVGGGTPCLTRWAQCWRIVRRDGVAFNFTSHDRQVVAGRHTYLPCNSLAASASDMGTVLGSAGDVSLSGIIADGAITEADLYAGLFDRARVEVWLAPWEDSVGELPFRIAGGVVGNLSQGDAGYSLEVLTDGAMLQQRPLLRVYGPGCPWDLGDSRCGVDLAALTVTGSVTELTPMRALTQSFRRMFVDDTRPEDPGAFDQGELTWTTGANAGQRSEVKGFSDGGVFVLWSPMRHAIAVGDQYEVSPGCNKTPDHCKGRFSNYANYGGFPVLPGRDAISNTPDLKV